MKSLPEPDAASVALWVDFSASRPVNDPLSQSASLTLKSQPTVSPI